MVKIYMLPSWSGSADHMRDLFIRQTPNSSGVWQGVSVTDDIKDADFHIQMDRPKNGLSNPSKTIYMNWEPPNKGGYYLCDDYDVAGRILFQDGHFPVMWFLDYTYDELKSLLPPHKSEKLSCVLSSKQKCEGHIIRHKFAKRMCDQYPNDIRLYGSVGRLPEFNNMNIEEAQDLTKLGQRGNFFSKIRTIKDYKYHLCMENAQVENYFTEKITDALLMWSMPIYWGCPNVADFLSKESMVMFNAIDVNEAHRVKGIIDDDSVYDGALSYIKDSRELILDKYNFCNVLSEFIMGKL